MLGLRYAEVRLHILMKCANFSNCLVYTSISEEVLTFVYPIGIASRITDYSRAATKSITLAY